VRGRRWQLSELLDLEHELELERRDAAAVPPPVNPQAEPGELLYDWLQARRQREPGALPFGERFRASESLLQWVGTLLAFLMGVGLTAGLLRYSGDALINVMAFLAVAVGMQLLGLFVSAAALVANHFRPSAGAWLLRITRVDQFAPQLTLSAALIRWRAFGLMKLWGVGLNLGILITLLFKVVFFDLSFGWATTLDVSAGQVHTLLMGLSLPWRGLFAGAVPSLQEVELSRIVLAQGVASGAASWWQFLFAAVCTYGLLPRLVLWIMAGGFVRWKLGHVSFSTAACQSLLLRLRQAPGSDGQAPARAASAVPDAAPAARRPPGGRYQLQLPPGWTALKEPDQLRRGFGVEVGDDGPESRILRLVESWRPPLEQDLVELQELLEGLPRDAVLLLGLIGLAPDETLVEPDAQDLAIWSEFLRRRVKDSRVAIVAFEEAGL